MSGNASEEALVSHLLKTRMVEAELINDAKDSQKMAAEHGLRLPLGEALVRLGAITAAQRVTLEKSLEKEQSPQLGNYKVIKKLGNGTMGNVYLAEDTVAQRKVALKVLNKQLADSAEFLNRFQSEAQMMGKLNHVNIISAFTVSHDKGKYFYAMEYCEGESLEEMLKRETVLSPGQALDVIKQVACGLEHAHAKGLVHRDIKPANIMLTADGVAKILDLGL
jgi:eukaryotic-like serine/threonine-protein kinase